VADALTLAAVALGRELRAAGLPVTPDRAARFARSAQLLRATDRDGLYWAARLAFVSARDQLPVFEAVFAAVVEGMEDPAGSTRGQQPPAPGARPTPPAPGGVGASKGFQAPPGANTPGELRGTVPVAVGASGEERLADKRLSELDAAELALLRRFRIATPPRRARRTVTRARGEHVDVRATLRRAHRTGGDPVDRRHRLRRERPRPLVALLDVSGSMEPYARAYLLLLEGAARAARAECFVFATRLTRVTRALRDGRAAVALEQASRAAPDWGGGTRIGDALRRFNDLHGRRGMARDAVVVILSDGWERGDPALVAREMERLSRLAYRIVWVNPRVAAQGFAPETGGMAAALPHISELVSGHSLAAIDEVLEAVARPR
jgi:uncharacterized protein with von Willebrand factor type A (vWA) domain